MINDDLKAIGDIVEQKIGKALEPIKEKLDNHTASLMKIEQTLEGYADMYKVNKEKNEELDERLGTVEEHLSITPQK